MSLNPTAIEWTHAFGAGSGYTWNPITGCTKGCDYCYARELVDTRLKDIYPNGFAPTFWEDRLRDVTPRQKPRGIFVGSMGDMWDSAVPQEWRDRVWQAMAQTPQHIYFTLTKQPQNLTFDDWMVANGQFHDLRWWQGVTTTRQEDMRIIWDWDWTPDFVSFEPLLMPLILDYWKWRPQWAIIGADSRPAGVAHITEPAWVEHLVEQCEAAQIPVFAKDNLSRVMGADWVRARQKWPEGLRKLRGEAD